MFEDRFTCLLSSSQQPDEQTTSRDKSVLFSLRVITACPLTLSHSTRMRCSVSGYTVLERFVWRLLHAHSDTFGVFGCTGT